MNIPIEVAVSLIATLGSIIVAVLARHEAKGARTSSDAVLASVSFTNGGSHLKDDTVKIMAALARLEVALEHVSATTDRHEGELDKLHDADTERARVASESHARIYERIESIRQ